MGRGRNIATILQPLNKCASQCYLGTGLHTLGLLNWILQQTGRADVYVSTFSTSEAFLNMNHSKIVLVQNDTHLVSVISSQNQTYGDRAECTMVTTDQMAFYDLYSGLRDIVDKNSIQLNGLFNEIDGKNNLHRGITERDNQVCENTYDPELGFHPIGI